MNVVRPKSYKELVHRYQSFHQHIDKINVEQPTVVGFLFQNVTRYAMVSVEEGTIVFHVFKNIDDLHYFLESIEDLDDTMKADIIFRLNFLLIDQRNVEEMFDEEYDAYSKAKIEVHDTVPLFRNFTSGYAAWVINEADEALILAAFSLFEQLFKQGEIPDYGHYTLVDEEWKQNLFYVVDHALSPVMRATPALEKLTIRKRGKWLIGLYYLPIPNIVDQEERPVHPLICLIVDEDSEDVIHLFDVGENKDPYISFNEQLYDFMKTNKKRPRAVALYGDEDYDCFSSLFEHLDVAIEQSNQFDVLNQVWLALEEEFMTNLETAMDEELEHRTIH